MPANDNPKPVPLYIENACKIDGQHIAQGTVLPSVDYELATDLVGAGRARLATAEDIAAAEAAAAEAGKAKK